METKGSIKISELDLRDLDEQMAKKHPEYKNFIYFKMTEKDGARFFGFGFKNIFQRFIFLVRVFFSMELGGGVMYFSRKM